MKNLMVANKQENSNRYKRENIERLLKAQIENSLELGWKLEDITVLANFDFEYMGIKSIIADLNESCLTGSKIFGLKWFFERHNEDDIIWAHDLDAWQNVWFEEPFFDKEGNVSFGLKEHIEIPGAKYDPELGIIGMNINISLERLGYRIKKRRRCRSIISSSHKVTDQDAMKFMKEQFAVEVGG